MTRLIGWYRYSSYLGKETGDPQVRFGAGRARERQLVWGTEGPGVHSVHQEVSTRTGAAGIERTRSCRVPLFF